MYSRSKGLKYRLNRLFQLFMLRSHDITFLSGGVYADQKDS